MPCGAHDFLPETRMLQSLLGKDAALRIMRAAFLGGRCEVSQQPGALTLACEHSCADTLSQYHSEKL